MAYDPMNPFGLPSPGASGASQNPLLASMDMMRQAMTGLGQSAQANSGSLSQPMTPEDLEQKINDLKVVENWLKLNLSMLSSSIQGLEVQLATVRTLRSFVAMGETPGTSQANDASPLEVALGLKPAPKKATAPREASTGGRGNETRHDAPDDSLNESLNEAAQKTPSGGASAPDANTNTAAAQAWWQMLENQFNQLASATTQANAAAQSAMADAASKQTAASGAKKATKAAAKKASQVATKTAKKAATKKSTPASRTKASRG